MKIMIESMSKPLSRGVFWIVDDKILAFLFYEDSGIGVAKSGNTYNHKKLWSEIKPKGCNKPYNYYPRGRVDISNKGKAIIYLNPNISEALCAKYPRTPSRSNSTSRARSPPRSRTRNTLLRL